MNYNKFTEDLKNSLPDNTTTNHDNLIITPAVSQTKDWRKTQPWYHGGKQNECELYQRQLLEQITQCKCEKTIDRINLETYQVLPSRTPMRDDDGFEWTEDFDGKQTHNKNTFYFNLKMVCDCGGAQTRSLREVYHFVKAQLKYLIKFNIQDTYFVNILDGNESHRTKKKFDYLLSKETYANVKNKVFVGDMHDFQQWFKNLPILQTRDE
jgi:hypothetical protein